MLNIYPTTKSPSAGLVRWGEIGHKPFPVLSQTCLAQMNFAEDVSPCLGGHSPGWHSVSPVCALCSSGCRAQCDQQAELCSAAIPLFVRGLQRAPRGSCPAACRGGRGQTGFWIPSVWEVATSFWAVAAILSGKGKLGTALPVLLVLLNCGMLVVDSVTFSVPCLPVFLYLLHLPLCQNAAIAKKKKKKEQNFCFLTVSPFDNL